jgi:hypothetical protein
VGILSGGVIARSLDLNEVYAGESNEVEVTVADVDPGVISPAGFGAEPVMTAKNLTILRCKGADNLQPLIAEIHRGGGKIVEVKPLKLDLEDIFVQAITERNHEKTTDEKKKADEMAFTR